MDYTRKIQLIENKNYLSDDARKIAGSIAIPLIISIPLDEYTQTFDEIRDNINQLLKSKCDWFDDFRIDTFVLGDDLHISSARGSTKHKWLGIFTTEKESWDLVIFVTINVVAYVTRIV